MALLTNLVAYWKLDESSGNAADASGNSNTLTNNNTVGFAAGKLNNAADFGTANTNKSLSKASNLGITGGNITLSGWVKMRTEIASGRQVLSPVVGGGTNNVEYHIRYNYNGGTRQIEFVRDKNGGGETVATFNITLGTSLWYHFAMTYDGTTIRGYINGVLVTTAAASGTGGVSLTAGTSIGTWLDGSTYASSSYQDEMGVWSRQLSDDEVAQLYNAGRVLPYPFTVDLKTSLESYYKLDESSGNAADSIGSNTLTNTGTVAYGTGLINNGADFGTANSSKKLAVAAAIAKGNITVAGWIKLKTAIASGQYGIWEQEDDSAIAPRIMNLVYNYNGGTQQLVADYHKNNVSDNNIAYTTTLSTSVWHHVAFTYDGATFTMYLDGVQVGTPLSISGGGSGSVSGNEFTLGLVPRYGNYGSIMLDEIGVWSRALTSTELLALVNGGAGLTYPFPTTYNQAMNAIGAGVAAVAKVTTKLVLMASTGAGIAAFKRSISKTLAASGAGIGNVRKGLSKTLTATGAGIAVLTASRAFLKTIAAVGAGTAAISTKMVWGKTLPAVGAGTAALTRILSLNRALAATGAGIATMTETRGIVMRAVGVGVATITVAIGKRLTAVGVGIAHISTGSPWQRVPRPRGVWTPTPRP